MIRMGFFCKHGTQQRHHTSNFIDTDNSNVLIKQNQVDGIKKLQYNLQFNCFIEYLKLPIILSIYIYLIYI